jgi:hypothetical protein
MLEATPAPRHCLSAEAIRIEPARRVPAHGARESGDYLVETAVAPVRQGPQQVDGARIEALTRLGGAVCPGGVVE